MFSLRDVGSQWLTHSSQTIHILWHLFCGCSLLHVWLICCSTATLLTNPLTVSTLALRYSVSTVSASFLLRYYYWVLSVDLDVIKRQYASFKLRLSVSSSVSNVAQPTQCWEMGFGCHLYVRGVVPSAKHYQHIATNSVQARGISFEYETSLSRSTE